jgi:uncharacterized Rmd1/YagE family protein
MNNPIKTIYKFNLEAGLLDQGYIDERECAYPIEEMLEGLVTSELSQSLGIPDVGPKGISRHIMHLVSVPMDMREVERLDKHLDAIVFCFGSIFKLGLSPQQAAHALEIVMQANMQKLHAGKDEQGKQLKPDSFVGPEAELQKILDKRDTL